MAFFLIGGSWRSEWRENNLVGYPTDRLCEKGGENMQAWFHETTLHEMGHIGLKHPHDQGTLGKLIGPLDLLMTLLLTYGMNIR